MWVGQEIDHAQGWSLDHDRSTAQSKRLLSRFAPRKEVDEGCGWIGLHGSAWYNN